MEPDLAEAEGRLNPLPEPSRLQRALSWLIRGETPAASHALLAPTMARAEYPERQVTMIVCFGAGGGTDIAVGLRYARQLISVPSRTLVILVSDFEDGGPLPALLAEVRAIAEAGAHPLGLAALDDRGAPRYAQAVAERVVAAGMPVASVTPLELARWVGEHIR